MEWVVIGVTVVAGWALLMFLGPVLDQLFGD